MYSENWNREEGMLSLILYRSNDKGVANINSVRRNLFTPEDKVANLFKFSKK